MYIEKLKKIYYSKYSQDYYCNIDKYKIIKIICPTDKYNKIKRFI